MSGRSKRFGAGQAALVLAGLALVVLAGIVGSAALVAGATQKVSARFLARADSIFAYEQQSSAGPHVEPVLNSERLGRRRRQTLGLAMLVEPAKDIAAGVGVLFKREKRPGPGTWGLRKVLSLSLLQCRVAEATRVAGDLGYRYECFGDSGRARRYLRVSYGLARMTGKNETAAWALERLAGLCPDSGEWDAALRYLVHALALYTQTESWEALARVQENVGCRWHSASDYGQALGWYLAARNTREQFGLDTEHLLGNLRLLRNAMGEQEFARHVRLVRGADEAQELVEELTAGPSGQGAVAGRRQREEIRRRS